MTESGRRPRIDPTVPHPARRYNYWLGGKDNFAADRASGDQIAKVMPSVRLAVLENRAFQRRVVRFLVREAGVRQFLDIGTGIPAPDIPHDVAQAIEPSCRVVYVDNDPVVIAHARALLNSSPEGATAYLEADAREPEKILSSSEVTTTLDFGQPVAVLMVALLHFLQDDEAHHVVRTLLDPLPPGSHLAVSHATMDFMPPAEAERFDAERTSGRHGGSSRLRSQAEVAHFFDGLELVPPGIVPLTHWRPEDEAKPPLSGHDVPGYGGVGRKP